MLSRAGLGSKIPKGPLLLILAANAPDIDVVSLLSGATAYFHYHRYYTHALAMVPVMAALVTAAVGIFNRSGFPWVRAYIAALIACLTHPLLDLTNPYGIRLLLPFSQDWLHLDLTSVIDVWIWLVLLLAVFGPALSRLVGSEIGARNQTGGRGWAITALVFLVLYNGGRAVIQQRAIAMQSDHIYAGESPLRATVFPDAVNPLRWVGVVETATAFIRQPVELWHSLDPALAETSPKLESSSAMDAVKATTPFQDMMGFSAALLWRAVPDARETGKTRVMATDLRFGFRAVALVDASNRVENAWIELGSPRAR